MSQKQQILKQYFGYDQFRPAQEEIIDQIVQGRDVSAIMPTSAGKSLCYQIPALMLSGITIVVSPLISLMQDQVSALLEMGIPALLINSSLSAEDYRAAIWRLHQGDVKLLYVAPERLLNDYFIQTLQQLPVSLVAVDEAHCISQWGNDFRPAYQSISTFLDYLPNRPVVAAFTATATPRVRKDISLQLGLINVHEIVTGFDRPNLYFAVEEPKDKWLRLLELVDQNEASIIYCSTRKDVDKLFEKLSQKGYLVGAYHAGLPIEERARTQEDFLFDRLNIIVATNAFGMGIDKPNVRQVIHYSMPKDIESYYQEAGRAGRDGEAAKCTLFYNGRDIMTNLFFLEKGNDPVGKEKLNEMIDYCRTITCLRHFMLDYFGQEEVPLRCEHCSNCTENISLVDVTIDAQKIISCIIRMNERFGVTRIIEVLRGSKNKEVIQLKLDQLSTYGILSEHSEKTLRNYIGALVADRYLQVTGSEYPVIKITPKGKRAIKQRSPIQIKRTIALTLKQPDPIKRKKRDNDLPYDQVLFERLRGLRLNLASQHGVPPFVIFSDASLRDMCRYLPISDEEFLEISGVGLKKLESYGDNFLSMIRDYKEEQGDVEE